MHLVAAMSTAKNHSAERYHKQHSDATQKPIRLARHKRMLAKHAAKRGKVVKGHARKMRRLSKQRGSL